MATINGNGDLNNLQAIRTRVDLDVDPAFSHISLAVPESEDDADVRARYRPFLLEGSEAEHDWVAGLELGTVAKMVQEEVFYKKQDRLRILVLYGSLRSRSFSRLLAFEFARILWRLGCDVRVYNPAGLPQKDDVQHDHVKVQELRELSKWSDGHVWVSPEQHGQLSSIFKQQIDWIPLSTGSVRPTQGRTLAVAQVSGGSQSFNTVNTLRVLGRWMRMFAIPNQSSVPVAYTQFTSSPGEGEAVGLGKDRMKPSSNRDRLVDCAEELVKYTIVMRPHFDLFGDRFSEREERRAKGEQRMPGM